MKSIVRACLGVFLATLLFAGCSNGNSTAIDPDYLAPVGKGGPRKEVEENVWHGTVPGIGNPESSSGAQSQAAGSSSRTSSGSTNDTIPEEERQIFYDVVEENLLPADGKVPVRVDFYYPSSSLPTLISIGYSEPGSGGGNKVSWIRVWKLEDAQPKLLYDDGALELFVNYETGNPVVMEQNDIITVAKEISPEEQIALYEYYTNEEGQRELYTYYDDRTWSMEEEAAEQPIQKLPLGGPSETLDLYVNGVIMDDETMWEKINEFILKNQS